MARDTGNTTIMKALVTGASGFIGSALIEELSTLGFEVHALMRKTSSSANLEGLAYQRVEGDVSDLASLKRAVTEMDYVFHLAGVISAPTKNAYYECNAEGTRKLAEAVAEKCPSLTRFVYVSSLAAGGPARSGAPRTEIEADKPVSLYGDSKRQGELELLKHKDRFPISIVRPPLVYGPRDRGVFVFVQTVSRNLMPILPAQSQDGKKYYSLIHAKDLCRGLVQAALVPKAKVASGEIFYLCGDGVFSYDEIMRVIAEKLNREPLRIPVPKLAMTAAAMAMSAAGRFTGRVFPLTIDKLNELLPDYWTCSNDKAKDLLGFAPEHDFKTGMTTTIEWYKKNQWI